MSAFAFESFEILHLLKLPGSSTRPTPDLPGTKFLHWGTFGRGLGLFSAIDYRPSGELPDNAEYPFFLTTGRHYAHYNARTMRGVVHHWPPTIRRQSPRCILTMLSGEAAIASRSVSRRGEVISTARTGDIVQGGAISMDFRFAEANSNLLFSTRLDPISKTPAYKVCAVRIEAA